MLVEINIQEPKWQQQVNKLKQFVEELCLMTLDSSGILSSCQDAEISFLLCDDEQIRQLNQNYRGKDKATNVLSFPDKQLKAGQYEDMKGQDVYLGDIAICYQVVLQESQAQNKEFNQHFVHMVIHGVLHLLGYDHEEKEDAIVMETLEQKILQQFFADQTKAAKYSLPR